MVGGRPPGSALPSEVFLELLAALALFGSSQQGSQVDTSVSSAYFHDDQPYKQAAEYH